MSEWIKVTPGKMPPDMEPVLVTVEYKDGSRFTDADVRYNGAYGGWEELADASGGYWADLGESYRVTHWMPYPTPARG